MTGQYFDTRSDGRSPTVSVGMPVYNGERFLAGAIDSILRQTFEDLELIISDNGSTDGTEEIARCYLETDERLRYVRSPNNRGVSWNFNEVFRQSRGRYFKHAAHDDLHAPTFLERCVDTYEEAPSSVVLVYPRTLLIDENGEELEPYDDGLDLRDPDPARRLRQYLRNVRMVNPLFGLHRRDAYGSTRLHQPYVSSDVVLLAELAMRGEFWEIPERLFLRRDFEGRSERAHGSFAELAAWYNPTRTTRLSDRRIRQLGGMLRAVLEAPLAPAARLRCSRVMLTDWAWRWKRPVVEELVGIVASSVTRRR